jgi:IclR family transcriptional regulator, KDG regulon repressor
VSEQYIVKPIEKAIRVLQCAGAAAAPISLKEISLRVGLPKTTVFRYLQTLRACGLIAHDKNRDLYRVDAGILALVPQRGELHRLREIALPHMRALQRRFDETINLGIVEGTQIVYIEIVESGRALRMQARVGGRDPLHSTAIGKAILAQLPSDVRHSILPPTLRQRTSRTITSVAALDAELVRVRARGYAEEEEENEMGAACISVPLFDGGNRAIAGLSIAAPILRLDQERRSKIARVLVKTADQIETALSFSSFA